MKRLFAFTVFASATLLFVLQPLVGKIVIPVLGGSPFVWSTCLVFFQVVLFLGYLYAHALSTLVRPPWQIVIHVAVLAAASITLPAPADIGQPATADPQIWLIRSLGRSFGLPVFALSATTSLLLRWFSKTSEPGANDPYFLYASSNAGSLVGLLGSLLLEPLGTRRVQVTAWSASFWVVGALVAVCAYVSISRSPTRTTRTAPPSENLPLRRVSWIALAFMPSALLLGVTQQLTTDVVSVPLLWVVPLTLYLATFIVAFSKRAFGGARPWTALAPWAVLAVLLLSLADIRYPIAPVALVHLSAFTVLAMMCHSRLAESRPDASHLTSYFLCISLGGTLGGAAVALVAPMVFSSIMEYPLALAAALFLRPAGPAKWPWYAAAAGFFVAGFFGVWAFDHYLVVATDETALRVLRASLAIAPVLLLLTRRTLRLFAGAVAGLLVAAGTVRTGGTVLYRERTFFGVHRLSSIQNGEWHELTHGTTMHGVQAVRGKARALPTAYYHPSGPIGDVVFTLAPDGRLRDIGVIGLGAGALSAYAGNGARIDFFEIDPAVIRIAENPQYFTYLADARARPGVRVNIRRSDGRIGLQSMPAASYDLIVVDAFSSDAVPTHLITREAVALFESRLKARGVMAFHVSSRFFDLSPVLAKIADDRHLVCYGRDDRDMTAEWAAEAKRPSVWVVLARQTDDLGQLVNSAPRWTPIQAGGAALWTDEYTNVLGVIMSGVL